jgi:mycoredoxin
MSGTNTEAVVIYSTCWCGDCRRAKNFLRERGVAFREVNIDDDPEAAALVMKVNNGKRKVPTIGTTDGRYFSLSPFDPCKLSSELNIPLNATHPGGCAISNFLKK